MEKKQSYWTQNKDNIWVAAHRGWCSKYPENTMEAIKAAVERNPTYKSGITKKEKTEEPAVPPFFV